MSCLTGAACRPLSRDTFTGSSQEAMFEPAGATHRELLGGTFGAFWRARAIYRPPSGEHFQEGARERLRRDIATDLQSGAAEIYAAAIDSETGAYSVCCIGNLGTGDLSALADFVNFHAAVILPDCTIVLNAISTPKPPGTLAISMPFRFLPSCDFWTVVFLLARVGLVAFIDPAGCFAHPLRLSHIRFGILQHQTFLLTKAHLYPQLLFARSENMAFAFHTSTDTAATMRACLCYLISQAIQSTTPYSQGGELLFVPAWSSFSGR